MFAAHVVPDLVAERKVSRGARPLGDTKHAVLYQWGPHVGETTIVIIIDDHVYKVRRPLLPEGVYIVHDAIVLGADVCESIVEAIRRGFRVRGVPVSVDEAKDCVDTRSSICNQIPGMCRRNGER